MSDLMGIDLATDLKINLR